LSSGLAVFYLVVVHSRHDALVLFNKKEWRRNGERMPSYQYFFRVKIMPMDRIGLVIIAGAVILASL
jgi:hypothetical protein